MYSTGEKRDQNKQKQGISFSWVAERTAVQKNMQRLQVVHPHKQRDLTRSSASPSCTLEQPCITRFCLGEMTVIWSYPSLTTCHAQHSDTGTHLQQHTWHTPRTLFDVPFYSLGPSGGAWSMSHPAAPALMTSATRLIGRFPYDAISLQTLQ